MVKRKKSSEVREETNEEDRLWTLLKVLDVMPFDIGEKKPEEVSICTLNPYSELMNLSEDEFLYVLGSWYFNDLLLISDIPCNESVPNFVMYYVNAVKFYLNVLKECEDTKSKQRVANIVGLILKYIEEIRKYSNVELPRGFVHNATSLACSNSGNEHVCNPPRKNAINSTFLAFMESFKEWYNPFGIHVAPSLLAFFNFYSKDVKVSADTIMDVSMPEEDVALQLEPPTKKAKTWQPTFAPPEVEIDDMEPEESEKGTSKVIRTILDNKPEPQHREENVTDSTTQGSQDEDIIALSRIPWFRGPLQITHKSTTPAVLRLHNEILQFSRVLEETAAEHSARREATNIVKNLCLQLWPKCDVQVFGSHANGLCIPGSDVDVVVLNSNVSSSANGVRDLARAWRKSQIQGSLNEITTARIPVLKVTLPQFNKLQVDISFNEKGGPRANLIVQQLMREMPALKPLMLLVKYYLWKRNLNEVFTGGLGSHTCLYMLVATMQLVRHRVLRIHQKDSKNLNIESFENLGLLLLQFLDLYGRQLNVEKVYISVTEGGYIGDRKNLHRSDAAGLAQYLQIHTEETTSGNWLGSGSFNYPMVSRAFAQSYARLITRMNRPLAPMDSLLAEIFDINDPLLQSRILQ